MYYYRGLLLQWIQETLERFQEKLQRQHRPAGVEREPDLRELDAPKLTLATPFFVLSTGRCGTLWLTRLLRLSKHVQVNHSDYPELIRHSRLAYEHYDQTPEVFQQIIRATRDEFIVRAYRFGQSYVETNNRTAFFAYAIKEVYPKAKFIHLLRHPGHFVRSGLSRGWYSGDQRHDLGRIRDRVSPQAWQAMPNRGRVAWLWNETNAYIEQFLESLDEDDFIQTKCEEMFADARVAMNICCFVGASDITRQIIEKAQRCVTNRGNKDRIKPYHEWATSEKAQVREHAKLAQSYGYIL